MCTESRRKKASHAVNAMHENKARMQMMDLAHCVHIPHVDLFSLVLNAHLSPPWDAIRGFNPRRSSRSLLFSNEALADPITAATKSHQ